MRRHRFFKYIPSPQALRETRFLKPLARFLEDHALWQFNRRAVAGGVAVGLFFGILSPFAQILLAAIGAIFLRVNLPVAAFSTFVTNPFTVPGVYYCAYLVGGWFTSAETSEVDVPLADVVEPAAAAAAHFLVEWFETALTWLQTVGPQVLIGLAVLSVVSAIIGYVLVDAGWRLWVRKRWHKRRGQRS
jgi:uncharacterized protein (DUF2062 family)